MGMLPPLSPWLDGEERDREYAKLNWYASVSVVSGVVSALLLIGILAFFG